MALHYIYLTLNKLNGHSYIGQHIIRNNDWHNDDYLGSGKILNKAINKYGKDNFEKFLLQYCNTDEEANKAEVFWIKEYRNREMAEYNIAAGGNGGNMLKYASEERKKEIGRKISNGLRNSEAFQALVHSEEHRKKISEANKGRHMSEEEKAKHRGKPAWNKGVHLSKEARNKISESMKDIHWYNNGTISLQAKDCPEGFVKGRHYSEETRKKMIEANKGDKNPMYGKLSPMKDKHHSEETKRKIAEAIKGKHWKLVDGKRIWY